MTNDSTKCSHSSIFSMEQQFWLVIRDDVEGTYVEFYDREIWGFRPSPYIYGATRDELIKKLDRYYGEFFKTVHPEYRRYVLELIMQIPWGRFR